MKVVLGVCGSIACYRACDLARDLMRAGFEVRTCLTQSASQFLSPVIFETLTGQPCVVDTFEEPVVGRMAHIDWAREADVVVIAPATANTINHLANGFTENMLTTLFMVSRAPKVIAPAMNPAMYDHETVQHSIKALLESGVIFVDPTEGDVACGEHGQGKLAPLSQIVDAAINAAKWSDALKGKKVLITSGPTRESIDDVRFLSNRSSGKMGRALAEAALQMGAEVTVISGPVSLNYPPKATVISVNSARDMLFAAQEPAKQSDIIIGAAAVADYHVANAVKGKLRRSDGIPKLELSPNPDIIAELIKHKKDGAIGVAFAAEPDEGLEVARAKLKEKGAWGIVVNNISRSEIGFESDDNEITLLTENLTESSGQLSKRQCARWLFEKILSIHH